MLIQAFKQCVSSWGDWPFRLRADLVTYGVRHRRTAEDKASARRHRCWTPSAVEA